MQIGTYRNVDKYVYIQRFAYTHNFLALSVEPETRNNVTLIVMGTLRPGYCFLIQFSNKQNQSFVEKWLTQGLQKRINT